MKPLDGGCRVHRSRLLGVTPKTQHCIDKKSPDKIDEKILTLWGMKTREEFLEMQKQFIGNSVYCWQTEGDDIFSAKASSMKPGTPRFIPANYDAFMKWRKPIS